MCVPRAIQALDKFIKEMKLTLNDMKSRPGLSAAVIAYHGELAAVATRAAAAAAAASVHHQGVVCNQATEQASTHVLLLVTVQTSITR